MKLVRSKAGLPMLLFTSIGMIIVGIIGGYFNVTVSSVLTIAAMCQLLVAVVAKLIYSKVI